jgi:uncharacterized protein
MANAKTIDIEVVYSLPDAQYRIELNLPSGSTALGALEHSGFVDRFPGIDPETCRLGVFGRIVRRDHVLSDGQRLEIYRPLMRDPKEARRKRAADNRGVKKPRR